MTATFQDEDYRAVLSTIALVSEDEDKLTETMEAVLYFSQYPEFHGFLERNPRLVSTLPLYKQSTRETTLKCLVNISSTEALAQAVVTVYGQLVTKLLDRYGTSMQELNMLLANLTLHHSGRQLVAPKLDTLVKGRKDDRHILSVLVNMSQHDCDLLAVVDFVSLSSPDLMILKNQLFNMAQHDRITSMVDLTALIGALSATNDDLLLVLEVLVLLCVQRGGRDKLRQGDVLYPCLRDLHLSPAITPDARRLIEQVVEYLIREEEHQ